LEKTKTRICACVISSVVDVVKCGKNILKNLLKTTVTTVTTVTTPFSKIFSN